MDGDGAGWLHPSCITRSGGRGVVSESRSSEAAQKETDQMLKTRLAQLSEAIAERLLRSRLVCGVRTGRARIQGSCGEMTWWSLGEDPCTGQPRLHHSPRLAIQRRGKPPAAARRHQVAALAPSQGRGDAATRRAQATAQAPRPIVVPTGLQRCDGPARLGMVTPLAGLGQRGRRTHRTRCWPRLTPRRG